MADRAATRRIVPRIPRNCSASCCGSTWRPATRITYTIPASNPFTQTAGYRPEIWALGLRNPWRFAFDRLTHDLYIADVGQDAYEEVRLSTGSQHRRRELRLADHGRTALLQRGHMQYWRLDPPRRRVRTWDQRSQSGARLPAGSVYRGAAFRRCRAVYFYGDYCHGKIWGLRHAGAVWATALLQTVGFNITTFGEDEAGDVYVADYGGGVIYRIVDQS